jgi:NAD(P)-dependent dehydrogenase (short-subunit alcohol dehydrogenase family)
MEKSVPGMTDRKVALVTAASRGMGAAIARRLAADGYDLALMSRSEDVVALAEEVGAVAVTGSVAVADDLRRLVDAGNEAFGRIDCVVSNTGHPPKGDLLSIGDDEWHAGLDLVLLNTVRLARLVTPAMIRQGGGSFVNISAFGAVEPSLDFPVSSVLRAGLGAFVKLYADRYGEAGVRMNSVLPGFVDSYEVDEATLGRIPLGRAGSVADVASVVSFLLSDDSRYITGQSVRVDGGLTRSF